jgi:hypothetical protein
MTRVANRDNEHLLLEFALRHTAVTVAERCRELRCGSDMSIGTAERAWANRSLRVRRDTERNVMTITVDLPLDTGELLEKALDRARDDEVFKVPNLMDTSWSTRQADAFVNLLQGYLTGETGGNNENHLVTIHVDASALTGGDGRAAVPLEAVKRHCCDGHAVVITETGDGEPLGIGRKSRLVPKSVERAVRARDNNRCVFPGCNNRRFLDCHHIEHRAHGGETCVGNLMSLCTKHHTLVHEGGFRIRKDFLDKWAFIRPDGIAIPDAGYVSRLDEDPPAGGFLSVPASAVREPPPPQYLH